ncbi:peptidase, M28 family [gut metagenome]|uniref:Carboxypeptidase Q n=1 Tax=gut metagenome TaxID=749906 RepID=J9GH85_9ZZZZ
MKLHRLCTLTLLAAALSMGPVAAQNSVVEKIITHGKNDNQVMHQLDILTNRFGGRLIGSDAYDNAAEWMLREFRKWGLEAHLEEAGELPVGFNRGPWFGRLLGGDQAMNLHFVTPSYTSGTKGVQRGHVVLEPRTQAEFDRMKHRLKGAWVLVGGKNYGFPLHRHCASDTMTVKLREYNAQNAREGKELREVPGLFYEEMCQAGVLGFVQAASVPLRALYDRELLSHPETDFDHLPEVCDIKLDEHQYNQIKQMVEERRDIWLEFDIRNHFKLGPVKYHNVVASIPGTKYPDEYVIVSGHLDAFDVATGGVDCGTGIGPMMEAARLLALSGARPKRTILFVAFAGEEFGMLGAKAFVKRHADKLSKISNLFNRDYGPLPPTGIQVPAAMHKDFVKVCEPLQQLNPDFPFEVGIRPPFKRPTQPGGTDASIFAMKGVPAFGFSESDVKGYNFNYGEIWHTERDLYNKNIPEYQEHAALVTAIVALGIANLDHLLSREGMHKE